jgi:hypothetical protein
MPLQGLASGVQNPAPEHETGYLLSRDFLRCKGHAGVPDDIDPTVASTVVTSSCDGRGREGGRDSAWGESSLLDRWPTAFQ